MSSLRGDEPYTPAISSSELKELLNQGNQALKVGDYDQARRVVWSKLRERPLLAQDIDRVGRWVRKWKAKAKPSSSLSALLLGQWTTSWLMSALEVEAWIRGVNLEVEEGEYDQVLQDSFKPINADLVILIPWNKRLLGSPNQAGIDHEVGYWQRVWSNLSKPSTHRPSPPKIIQVGYDIPSAGAQGIALAGQGFGALDLIRQVNHKLRTALPEGVYFADLSALASEVGKRIFYDARQYHWTKQPLSQIGVQSLATLLWAGCRALTIGPKKVLVLDLDHTLWGGVVGDEGATGVSVGGGADGEAFSAFQRHCKALSQRGILLAVASKNHLEDAQAPFKEHPEMILKLEDFAAFEAHWESKAISIQRIADTLKLGLDSFVFFDDHPVERAVVRDLLPEVEVVDVPKEPALYVEALERGRWFESAQMTQEDLMRAQQYQQEQARRSLTAQFESLEAYLLTLEMRAEVRPLSDEDLPRVMQLIGKTNQFNFTTRRHSQPYVESLRAQARALCLTLRVSDRFGDYGLVSVILATPHPAQPQRLEVDTWLMSCRVIGRSVEQGFFTYLVEAARELGYRELQVTYCPTRKNRLISDLLPSLGGSLSSEEEAQVYLFQLEAWSPPQSYVSLTP